MTDEKKPANDSAAQNPDTRQDFDATLTQTDGQIADARELSARSSQSPSEVEGYSFIRQIGEGAYGVVWLARENNTGKQVAIKFYTHRRGLDWSLLNREVEKLAVLYTSRNIIGLLDVGWDNDPPYYVMEYLANGSLASYLADGPLPVGEAVRITRLISQALVQAHGAGILHCDLKPANVLLDSDLEPRLCDFGQSRLSNEQNPALGTLFYMAREQADLDAVPDARWDVYALGALMYQMLTGEPPHGTPDNHAIIKQATTLETRLVAYRDILSAGPPPEKHRKVAGVDRRLADIISRCLQVDPQKRYPNAQAVLDRLQYRDRQRARRPMLLLGIIGPALLLAAMTPIFLRAMHSNVETLEEELTKRALESDAVVAFTEAKSLEDEIRRRADELMDAAVRIGEDTGNDADFAKLRRLVANRDTGTDAEKPDEAFKTELIARLEMPLEERPVWLKAVSSEYTARLAKLTSQKRVPDTSWFMTDRYGYQMWRFPAIDDTGQPQSTLGKNFVYRDYFHGDGATIEDQLKTQRADLDPASVVPFNQQDKDQMWHMSEAFVSNATHRKMVAITVPVYSKDGEFIGMLGRTNHLFELLSNLHLQDDVDRKFALSDGSRLLDHSWIPKMRDEWDTRLKKIGLGSEEFFDGLLLNDDVRLQLADGVEAVRFPKYVDPVSRIDHPEAKVFGDYSLGAFAEVNVGDKKWWVIVQESAKAVRTPVREMETRALQYAGLAFLVLVPIIGLLWYLLSRSLNDRGSQQWPKQGNSRSGRLTGISTQ